MTPLTCEQVREQIDLHAVGEAAFSDADMEHHLEHCARCRQEFEQAQELMAQFDWHHRETAALDRLLTTLEVRPQRKAMGRQPWLRRSAALAASLFILSLLSLLYPTVNPPSTTDSSPTVVAWLEPEQRGDPPAPGPERPQIAHGSMAEITVRSRTEETLTPTTVDLALSLANPEKRSIYLHPEDPETSLQLELSGPRVRRDTPRGKKITPSLTPRLTTLKPGERTNLPLLALIDGTRNEPSYLFCVEPGTYTLTIRYRVRVSYGPDDPGTWRIFSSRAITLRVDSR